MATNIYGQQLDTPDWMKGQGQLREPGVTTLPAYPTAPAANAANLAYTRGAIQSDPTFAAAKMFLNPNDPTAMRDVAQRGAENAVGTGMVGSGIAGLYTGRLREQDIERRAALGSQLLSGAYGRTPGPVNPYAQGEAEFQNFKLLDQIHQRYGGGGQAPTVMGGGGGGRSAPVVIGGGGMGQAAGYGTSSQGAAKPLNVYDSAGSDQVGYGVWGSGIDALQQRSQFYPGEYSPGTTFAGAASGPTEEDIWGSLGA